MFGDFFYFAYNQCFTIILKLILRNFSLIDVSFKELFPLHRQSDKEALAVRLRAADMKSNKNGNKNLESGTPGRGL